MIKMPATTVQIETNWNLLISNFHWSFLIAMVYGLIANV